MAYSSSVSFAVDFAAAKSRMLTCAGGSQPPYEAANAVCALGGGGIILTADKVKSFFQRELFLYGGIDWNSFGSELRE